MVAFLYTMTDQICEKQGMRDISIFYGVVVMSTLMSIDEISSILSSLGSIIISDSLTSPV